METERLYYQDAYLRVFAARVLACRERDGKTAVALDRTAFYPTGGGQPSDMGVLDGVAVQDVVAEDGMIWHVLEVEPRMAGRQPGDLLNGSVDWPRRFDHMQQHTGQHILSQAFIQQLEAETVAFHLGREASTIDLDRIDITREQMLAVEAAANAVLDEARPVSAVFVEEAELAQLPLRKPPKVSTAIRVVQVAGYDWSACGGTHVANTAEIGAIKITGAERRGPEMRVTFLCGGRARQDHARLQTLAEGLVARFTVGQQEILEAVDRRTAEAQVMRRELAELEGQWASATAAALLASARVHGQVRVVKAVVDGPIDRAKRVAQALRAHVQTAIFLGVRGERPQLIFAASDDLSLNAGDLLRGAAAMAGGRGGGRPDWAQGGVPTDEGLEQALTAGVVAAGLAA